MASADEYAAWIVKNEALKGTPEFETVARAYQEAKAADAGADEAAPSAGGGFWRQLGGGAADMALAPFEWFQRRQAQPRQLDQPATPEERRLNEIVALREKASGPPPETASEFMGRNIGEVAVASVPFMAMPWLAAPAAVTKVSGVVPRAVDWYRRGAAVARAHPKATIAAETLGVGGSGALGGLAEKAEAPWYGKAAAELAGGVGGGLLPTVSRVAGGVPLKLAVKGYQGARGLLDPDYREQLREQAGGALRGIEASSLEELAALRAAERDQLAAGLAAQETINAGAVGPKLSLSVGEASGDPAMLTTQRALERGASGDPLRDVVARRRGNVAAIGDFEQRVRPTADAAPEDVAGMLADRVAQSRAALAARGSAVAAERQAVAELPVADKFATGGAMRESLKAHKDAASAAMTKLAKDSGISDADVSVPYEQWRAGILARNATGALRNIRDYPEVLARIKQVKGGKEIKSTLLDASGQPLPPRREPMTFQDMKDLREWIGDELRDTIGGAMPNRQKARVLVGVRQSLDKMLDGIPGDLGAAYKDFRQRYFKEYIVPYEKGAAFKVRERDGRGFYKTADEKVAETFYAPGKVSAAKQFNEIFAGDAEQARAMENVILDNLRVKTVKDGVVNESAFDRWRAANGSVLDEFPAVRAKIDDLGKANAALAARETQIASETIAHDREFITHLAARYAGTAIGPDQVIGELVKDPRRMSHALMAIPGERRDALARVVWDHVVATGAGNPQAMIDYMRANERAIAKALGPENMKNLLTIQTAMEMVGRTPEAAGKAFAPNTVRWLEEKLSMRLAPLASRLFAFQSGRMQKGYLITDVLRTIAMRKEQQGAEALLPKLLYDPDGLRVIAEEIRTGRKAVGGGMEAASVLPGKVRRYLWGVTGTPPKAFIPGMALQPSRAAVEEEEE